MARAAQKQDITGAQGRRHAIGSTTVEELGCARCGGFLVKDFSFAFVTPAGSLMSAATRCVQCGDVQDPVIQRNRRLFQESGHASSVPGVSQVVRESVQ